MRDRLIELLSNVPTDYAGNRGIGVVADYLLTNGGAVFPCNVGDTVYSIMADKRIKQPYEYKVMGIWYSADETCSNVHLARYINGVFESSMSIPFSEFGKIVFSTREEAEKRQKELKDARKEDAVLTACFDVKGGD